MVPDGGYGYDTVKKFPNGVRLSSSNTVTVTGTIPHYAGISGTGCLGPAEGSATSGYIAFLCNNGQWYIDSVTGLGGKDPVVGGQLATGPYPYSYTASYAISLTFRAGTGNLSVTLQGGGGPLTQTFSTGPFTPAAIGYALESSNSDGSPYDQIATLSGFVYTVN